MENVKCLDSIFEFICIIIEYYKHLKKNGKWNARIPSQRDIGDILSGGLGNNYARYKKEKRFPDILGKNVSDELKSEYIYKCLFEGEFIPQNKVGQKEFVEYLHLKLIGKLKNGFKSYCMDESIKELLKDLNFFKDEEDYTQYIKCAIEYSIKKPGCLYISKIDGISENTATFEQLLNSGLQTWESDLYKDALKRRIMKTDWYGKYIDLHVKDFAFKLRNYGNGANIGQSDGEHDLINIEKVFFKSGRILLLGNPGAGKTTALLKIALECLNSGSFLPVYIELEHYREQPIDEFIYETTGKRLSEIQNDKYLILFDGLNELNTPNSRFYEYLDNMPLELANQKVIVTCRPNNYNGNLQHYDTYTMLPISKSDIIGFWEVEFPGMARDIYNQMNPNVKELINTPLLLIMLTGVLKCSSALPNNLGELFRSFIEYIFTNWESGKGDKYMACDKIEALSEFAYHMYFVKHVNSCGVEEAQRVLSNVFEELEYSKKEQRMVYNEVLTNGLIQQKLFIFPVAVSFCHQSFLEYFASKTLVKRMLNDDFYMFGKMPLDLEILNYLKDMIDDNKMLESMVFNEKMPERSNYLQSNAFSLLHIKGFSFKKRILENCYLPKANLKNVDFYKANLSNAYLAGSDLRGANLTGTKLENTDLSGCLLTDASFSRCSIRSIVALSTYNQIAFVGDSNKLKLWDWKTNKVMIIGEHDTRIRKVDYNSITGYIATGAYDNSIALWNVNGDLIERLLYHDESVLALSFSPDGKYLVSGDGKGEIVIYSIQEHRIVATLNEHKNIIREIIFMDNDHFVSASWDKTVALWDLKSYKQEALLCDHKSYAFSVACNPKTRTVASVGADGYINIVDLNDKSSFISIATGRSLRDVEYSTNGQYLAVGGKTGKVQIWEGQNLCIEWLAHYFCVRDFVFASNDILITSGDDSSIKIWKIDYEKGTSNCITEMVDEEIHAEEVKGIVCKGLNIANVSGLTPERRLWLLENGAVEKM